MKPLRRVPKPTKGYIELKIYIHNRRSQDQPEAIRKFYQKFKEYSESNDQYISNLLDVMDYNFEHAEIALARDHVFYTGEGIDPIERIQTKNGFKWMLLSDFDFFRIEGQTKMVKKFIVLNPEIYFQGYPFSGFQWPSWLIQNVLRSKHGKIPPWVKIEAAPVEKTLNGEKAEVFEKKREIAKAKIRYPYKDDDEEDE